MARATQRTKALTTSQARKDLPKLARAAAQRTRAGTSLREHAILIQPRDETRGAYLIPEIDVTAAERHIQELEEELEDIALMRLLEQRTLSGTGALTPVDDVIRELGFDALLSS